MYTTIVFIQIEIALLALYSGLYCNIGKSNKNRDINIWHFFTHYPCLVWIFGSVLEYAHTYSAFIYTHVRISNNL